MAVEIIAEIANAHQGDPDTAARLAEAAFDAGADAVKFQVYFAEELLVERHPRFAHFSRQSFSPETWADLLAGAVGRGTIYCDVFGLKAADVALEGGAAGVKVHSSDSGNIPLLRRLAEADGRIFLSAGGTTLRELIDAVATVSGGDCKPVLMHGFQSYPTEVADSQLARIAELVDVFGDACEYGYADHAAGDDVFATLLPAMALPYGIRYVEKHVTFRRADEGVDYYSSIDMADLPKFIETVRAAETGLGGGTPRFSSAERHYRDTVKKHFVTARALRRGDVIAAADLVMKRVPDADGDVLPYEMLVGRELAVDVPVEHQLGRGDVVNTVWALPVARSASSRLPGKALLEIAGMPALAHLFERLKRIPVIDHIVFCTTELAEDDELAELAAAHGVACHRGPVDNVLARMLGALEGADVDVVLRVTGDDILTDRDYVERAVRHHFRVNAEYTDLKELPGGTEVEVFDVALLRSIMQFCSDGEGTEYLTSYVIDNADQFRTARAPVDPDHARDWRLTLDTPEDLQVVGRLLEGMRDIGKPLEYTLDDITAFFDAHPEVLELNADVRKRQTPVEVDTRLAWQVERDAVR